MSESFYVRVYEVATSAPDWRNKPLPAPRLLDQFSVQGHSHDQSKDVVRARLQNSGRKIRSMSWGPDENNNPQIITYVYPKEAS